MAGRGNATAAAAALLVLATLLGLHMPLVEGDLSQYTSSQLARWTFDGNLDDQENAGFPWHGPAVPKGSNVQLAFDNDISGEVGNGGYIKIRQPGYLNLPAVHFNEDPAFTVTFSLRIPSYPSSRQILYADWTGPHWQFLTVINPPGQISVSLRRNMTTDGSNPDQGLLDFDSGNTKIPVGAWFDVAFQFDRSTRTGKLFLDQVLVGSATVRSSLADADVVLMRSSSASYQFGRKADTDAAGLLDADLRNFRIFGTAIAN